MKSTERNNLKAKNKYPFPVWKRAVSFLIDYPLADGSSVYHDKLKLWLSKDRLKLNSTNATYSYADLYTSFSITFKHLKFENLQFKNALILGWGMGSIAHLISKKYKQDVHYTAVEIDPRIIEWNKDFNDLLADCNIDLIEADAASFVQQNKQTYDLICVDLFKELEVPVVFKTISFLRDIQKSSKVGTLILFNHIYDTAESQSKAKIFYENTFQKVFSKTEIFVMKGNAMFIAKM